MKAYFLIIPIAVFALASCSGKKSNAVEAHIDSIITHNKQELATAVSNIEKNKNLLPELVSDEKSAASALEFRKNERYETEGFYYAPGQTISNTTLRSFMAQVGERGTLLVSAIFPTTYMPSHIEMKTPDNVSFVCDMQSCDIQNAVGRTVIGFPSKTSGEILNFIHANENKSITIMYDGYIAVPLSPGDKASLLKVFAYYDAMRKRKDKELVMKNDSLHIKFLERKLAEEEKMKKDKAY